MSSSIPSSLQGQISQYEENWRNIQGCLADLSNKRNRSLLKTYLNQMRELSRLIQHQLSELPSSNELKDIQDRFININTQFAQNESNLHTQLAAAEESYEDQPSFGGNYYSQAQTEDEEMEEIEYISQMARQLVSEFQELKQIADETDKKIREQHHLLVKIDSVTKSANDNMTKGNQEIAKAEKHQKKYWFFRK